MKGSRQPELTPDPLGQRPDPHGFRRVVSRVEDVHAQLRRIEVGVVGTFAGDEGVHARVARLGNRSPGATGDDADPFRGIETKRI